jgi:hypothetical protein
LQVQPSQPLPGILNFGEAGVGVFPEVEEFVIVFAGSDHLDPDQAMAVSLHQGFG